MEIKKEIKEIENKFGIEAYNRVLNIYAYQFNKIKELEKSRDNWRSKYEELKNEKPKNK